MNEQALIIFVKNPVSGKVKTRLAASIGDEKALKLYRILLGKIQLACDAIACKRYVFYSDFIDTDDAWDSKGYMKRKQVAGPLGERMHAAIEEVFVEGAKNVVLIGSDIYGLTPAIIADAFESLKEKAVVVGPAWDGGYYLIGMNKPEPAAFKGMTWSHDEVLKDTLMRLNEINASVALLPPLKDIDVAEDLKGTDLSELL